jgi:hypothetical protein
MQITQNARGDNQWEYAIISKLYVKAECVFYVIFRYLKHWCLQHTAVYLQQQSTDWKY